MIHGRWPVWVRSATPDLRTAIANLTEEFDCLDQLLPEGYSGLIVDGGGYIGTAALKFSKGRRTANLSGEKSVSCA